MKGDHTYVEQNSIFFFFRSLTLQVSKVQGCTVSGQYTMELPFKLKSPALHTQQHVQQARKAKALQQELHSKKTQPCSTYVVLLTMKLHRFLQLKQFFLKFRQSRVLLCQPEDRHRTECVYYDDKPLLYWNMFEIINIYRN